MIRVFNKDTNAEVGTITEQQLKFLTGQMEEENVDDVDYWLHREQLEVMRANGAEEELLAVLEKALGTAEDVEITWIIG
ncbi:MAG: hypothetical protein K1X67_03195 [Fimbriimonadaceae bacterium]|nr:hypothetical protein [Fimbriimonadaceae bacterium]